VDEREGIGGGYLQGGIGAEIHGPNLALRRDLRREERGSRGRQVLCLCNVGG
jgi:hypothetical protein